MKELVCIVCPRGCHLKVDDNLNVSGNFCKRGAKYAVEELTHPMRNITSTVKLESLNLRRLPIKTSGNIPKEKMFEVMEELNKVIVKAPVKMNEIIIKNVLNLGVDIISTREVLE